MMEVSDKAIEVCIDGITFGYEVPVEFWGDVLEKISVVHVEDHKTFFQNWWMHRSTHYLNKIYTGNFNILAQFPTDMKYNHWEIAAINLIMDRGIVFEHSPALDRFKTYIAIDGLGT